MTDIQKGKWPGLNNKFELQEFTQRVQRTRTGAQLRNFPMKVKIGFYQKPYIGSYQFFNFQQVGQTDTVNPLVFRCRDSFRLLMPYDSRKKFYILIADEVRIINGIEKPYFKPEAFHQPKRIYYAGDQQRTAVKPELIYTNFGSLSGYVEKGTTLRDGQMLHRKFESSYLTPADIEIYCPVDATKIFNITEAEARGVVERWITLKAL